MQSTTTTSNNIHFVCPNCKQDLGFFYNPNELDKRELYCPRINCQFSTNYSTEYLEALDHYKKYKKNIGGFEFTDNNNDSLITPSSVETDKEVYTEEEVYTIHTEARTCNYNINLDKIIGHEPVKTTIIDTINATKPINLLLSGSPSTSKTFMIKLVQKQIEEQNPNSTLFIDCATSTFSGLSTQIQRVRPSIIFLDELESYSYSSQRTLLNLLQNQTLHISKHRNIQNIHLPNLKVIATTNNLSKLLEALRSRMLIMYLRASSETEYKFITRKMLLNQFDYINEEVAEYIGQVTWNIKPTYLRLVNRVAILIKPEPTKNKVDQVIDNITRYSIPESELKKMKVQM
jgi:hypothetical protein